MRREWLSFIVPGLAVFSALVICAIIIALMGKNPFQAYFYLLQGAFWGKSAIAQTLIQATPLIYTGLAVAFAFKAGLFNIGAQGQLIAGALVAAALGAFVMTPLVNNLLIMIVLVCSAGFLFAAIAGWLKAKLGVHEVISTIMLNYVAIYLENYMLNYPLKEGGLRGPSPQSPPVMEWVQYWHIVPGTNLNFGIIIALVCAFIVWFILNKTVAGYEIKAVGYNASAAENAGINVSWRIILAMGLSGSLAALAGAERVLGGIGQDRYLSGLMADYGFDGIAVALLGKNHPAGVVIAAILFGALRAGAMRMQFMAHVPSQVIVIAQAIIIVLIAAENIFRFALQKFFGEKAEA